MEWHNQESENMEVDIGFVSKMELISSMPSMKATLKDEEGTQRSVSNQLIKPLFENVYEDLIGRIKWDEQIEMKEAFVKLEQSFFPFKQVTYYPFLEALKKAQELNKYVHFILLWGALDDQSC
jgi:hypothetical protein